jgi:type VI secretion system protein ImpA
MPTAPLYTDDFLEPVSTEQPVGTDLRWTAEWDRIKEARRADDDLDSGKWVKKERKTADWRMVEELASSMLRNRSKDLQLALWLTEAGMQLHGFPASETAFALRASCWSAIGIMASILPWRMGPKIGPVHSSG